MPAGVSPRQWVFVVAVLAGLVASTASAAPTEVVWWDAVLKFAFAFVMVLVGSAAPRWATISVCSVAAAASGIQAWAIAGWLGLGLVAGTAALRSRDRVLTAVGLGAAVQAMLRLPDLLFFGFPSLLVGGIFALTTLMGYRYSSRQRRRIVRQGVAFLLAFGLVLLFSAGVTLLGVREDANQGILAARNGTVEIRNGNLSQAQNELEVALRRLESAKQTAASPWAKGLRLIPIAAQHHNSLEVALEQAVHVVASASVVIEEDDVLGMTFADGSIDVAALSQVAPRLQSAAVALRTAALETRAANHRWLLPPFADRLRSVEQESLDLLPEVELASDAAQTIPELLGLEGPQRYFVMFGTPAESRELGGFLGSWALMTANQGSLAISSSGRISELYDVAAQGSIAPGTVSDWFLAMNRPTRWPQNLTGSPDFRQVASVSRQVLAGASDGPIDGFIYLDAWAVIDLLQLSGEVDVAFQEAPLTADNAADFFFFEQYRFEGIARTEIFDQLASVAGPVLTRLSSQSVSSIEEVARVLAPAARGGRLQMVTFDETHNEFLERVHLLREFGNTDTQDFVGLVQTNALGNKMDLYLYRELDYQVAITEDGQLNAIASATLRSDVPADAPPFTLGSGDTEGVNKVLLSLYSPLSLDDVTVNGVPGEVRIASEFGMGRYLVTVTVPPNAGPTVVEYSLSGSVSTAEPYSLEVWHQPLVNSDQVAISVTGPEFGLEWAGELVENLVLAAETSEAS